MTHLTDEELRAFAAGDMASTELQDADDHLSDCERCRARAAEWPAALRGVKDLTAQFAGCADGHLSDDEIQAFVRGLLAPDQKRAAVEHMSVCAVCARQVDDLRDWIAPRRSHRLWALAAAVLIAAIMPAGIWYARSVGSTRAGSLSGLESVGPHERARVQAALDSGAVSMPAVLRDLRGTRDVLLGPAARLDRFGVTTPVGLVSMSARPEFAWRPLAGATRYVVMVFDEQSRPIARSPAIDQTTWTPEDPLPREITLVWQVEASRGNETVTVPASPTPPARFRVLDAASAAALQRIERDYPGSHLLLGILFADAGVVDRAKRHLEQVRADDPRSPVARETLRWLNDLRSGSS